jgi:hypothetical protein
MLVGQRGIASGSCVLRLPTDLIVLAHSVCSVLLRKIWGVLGLVTRIVVRFVNRVHVFGRSVGATSLKLRSCELDTSRSLTPVSVLTFCLASAFCAVTCHGSPSSVTTA